MFYAFLNAVSTVIPTATTAPTAAPIPTPTVSPLPVFVSIVDSNGWEIAGVIGSVFLGLAALSISIFALLQANRQQSREEELRKREAKIAVMDKAFSVYRFFEKDFPAKFFEKKLDIHGEIAFINRMDEVRFVANMLFSEDTYNEIDVLLSLVSDLMFYETMDKDKAPEQHIENLRNMAKKYHFEGILSDDMPNVPTRNYAVVYGVIMKRINNIFNKYKFNL